jgi:hypothetical protein
MQEALAKETAGNMQHDWFYVTYRGRALAMREWMHSTLESLHRYICVALICQHAHLSQIRFLLRFDPWCVVLPQCGSRSGGIRRCSQGDRHASFFAGFTHAVLRGIEPMHDLCATAIECSSL